MDREEYKKFMTYLFREYVSDRPIRSPASLHRKEWHEWNWEWENLRAAIHAIRYIDKFCADEDDISGIFKPKFIERLPTTVLNGLRWNLRVSESAGFLDALDAYYEEVIGGMTYEDMPPEELEILRALGSNDPETELRALIQIVKAKSERRSRREYDQEVHLSERLKAIEEKLEYQCKNLEELKERADSPPKKPRRWFKGLGQIAQGSALSIANVALAVGALPFPVAAETATWGALVSSATGVGIVINGVGELRGE